MANLTLADARTNVSQLLDDVGLKRWTAAQVDVALAQALSACVSQFVSAGGTALSEDVVVVGSAAGVVALSSVAPILDIRGVRLQFGTGTQLSFRPVPAALRADAYAIVNSIETVTVSYVRDFRLPSTTSHPIVGVGAAEAPSWPDFERWICADAAAQLGVKDNDQRPMLQALEAKAKANVLGRVVVPKAYPLSLPRFDRQRCLSYIYNSSSTAPTLQLVRARGEGDSW